MRFARRGSDNGESSKDAQQRLDQEADEAMERLANVGAELDAFFAEAEARPIPDDDGHREPPWKQEFETVQRNRKKLGRNHPTTLQSMADLARLHFVEGRWGEALRLHKEVLMRRRKALGDHHPDTAKNMADLALTYSPLERHEEAFDHADRALTLRRELLGPSHPDTLTTMGLVSASYYRLGQDRDSMELREEALRVCREAHGDNHPDTLLWMGLLASTYADQGRHEPAKALYLEALGQMKGVDPPPPELPHLLYGLAFCHFHLGEHAEAVARWREVWKLAGTRQPDLAWSALRAILVVAAEHRELLS